jgi:hypothetical protein
MTTSMGEAPLSLLTGCVYVSIYTCMYIMLYIVYQHEYIPSILLFTYRMHLMESLTGARLKVGSIDFETGTLFEAPGVHMPWRRKLVALEL